MKPKNIYKQMPQMVRELFELHNCVGVKEATKDLPLVVSKNDSTRAAAAFRQLVNLGVDPDAAICVTCTLSQCAIRTLEAPAAVFANSFAYLVEEDELGRNWIVRYRCRPDVARLVDAFNDAMFEGAELDSRATRVTLRRCEDSQLVGKNGQGKTYARRKARIADGTATTRGERQQRKPPVRRLGSLKPAA